MTKSMIAINAAVKKGYYVKFGLVYKRGKRIKTRISHGYERFNVRYGYKTPYTIQVHRLVAFQKFGDVIFNTDIQVRHLDSNSLNNSEENIGIGSPSQNNMDKPVELRILMASKANKKYDHDEIVRLYKNGNSYGDIMKQFNISSKGTISFIIRKSLSAGNSIR